MSEMKSAWEIAQEKAERLGRLSPEEERRQREQRCQETAAAIVRRFLDSPDFVSPAAEVERQPEGDRPMVRSAVVRGLLDALDFEQTGGRASGGRIVRAVSDLDPGLSGPLGEIEQLLQDYDVAVRRVEEEDRQHARDTLHRLRISGSAIAEVNPGGMPEFRRATAEVARRFRPRLEALKRTILQTSS